MEEVSRVKMIERVVIAKFDHTEEDHPKTPIETITQETVTEVSIEEAALMGFIPLGDRAQVVEPTVTVKSGSDEGGHVGD